MKHPQFDNLPVNIHVVKMDLQPKTGGDFVEEISSLLTLQTATADSGMS